MRIRKIALENLNSLRGRHEVDFTSAPLNSAGIIAITGETGAGKSTLLDAILLALFHKTARKHEKEVVSYGHQEAWAEVEFDVNEVVYRCRWEVKLKKRGNSPGEQSTPQASIMQYGDDGWFSIGSGLRELKSSNREAGLVEQIIGLNYDQFCKSVILPQGDFAAFLTATEADRAAILERLTNTSEYGRLGTAAYEKHDTVRQELERTEQRLRELQLPTAEELNQWRQDEAQARATLQQLEVGYNALLAEQRWYEETAKVESNLSALQQNLKNLQEAQEAMQPDLLKLKNHQLVQPFLPRIEALGKKSSELTELNQQLENEQAEHGALSEELKGLSAKLQELEETLTLAEQQIAVLQPQVKEYSVLEERGRLLAERYQQQQEALQKLEKEQLAGQHQVEQAQKDLFDWEEKHAKTQEWLEKNRVYQHISTDFAALEIELKQLAAVRGQLDKKQTELRTIELEINRDKSALEELRSSTQRSGQIILDMVTAQDHALAQEGLDRNRLNRSIEDLRALQFALSQVREQRERYQSTLREIGSLREQQDYLVLEEQQLMKRLLNLLDEQDEYKQLLILRKEIFEQQTRLHFLATERAALQDGQPCPVCGALDHPAAHDTLALVTLAESDYQQAEHRKQELDQQIATLQFEMQNIQAKLGDRIAEGEWEATPGLVRLYSKSEEEERRLGTLLREVQSKSNPLKPPAKADEITDFVVDDSTSLAVDQALERQVALRSRLEEEQKELDKLQHQKQLNEAELASLEAKLVAYQQSQDSLKAALQQEQTELHELELGVNQRLTKYQVRPDREPLAILSELQKHMDNWIRGNEALLEQGKEILTAKGNLAQARQALEKTTSSFGQTKEQLEAARLERDACLREMSEKFGNTNPQVALTNLSAQLAEAKEVRATQDAQKQQLVEKLALLQGSIEKTQKQKAALSKVLQQEKDTLVAELIKVGVEAIADVSSLVLGAQEAEHITSKQKQLEQDIHTLHTQITGLKGELEAKEASRPKRTLELLTSELEGLVAEREEKLKLLGSLAQRIEDSGRFADQAKELQKQAQDLRAELSRWERMLRLIGSKDGNQFRKFAQGITLDNLVYHANQHLKRLFGRYKISRVPTAELELEIIDQFQSDHRRSVKSVSGGETFLISLALALGLSDLAGQKTRIQSVFIDEGFGSLDSQTLDTAIEALENLQAEGVTIGIISHIPALHERIGTRISVRKVGSGYSTIEVEG